MVPKQLALLLCTALGAIAAPSAQSDGALEVPQEPQESALPTHPLQDQLHYQEEGDCDGRWMKIGKLLLSHFVKENGECTESARQCIRLPFHDCFPDGGCDGSILLTDECSSRRENAQLIPMCEVLSTLARQYHVGAADLINFAGCKYSFSSAILELLYIYIPINGESADLTLALSACQQGVPIWALHPLLCWPQGQQQATAHRPAAAAHL